MGTTGTAAADNVDLLREAIARNAALVLSLPTPARLRHHKSRFLADAGDGFWIVSVADEPGVLEEVIVSRKPVGVSFRSGEFKVVFAAPIQHYEPQLEWAAGAGEAGGKYVEALLLEFPTEIRAIQRRKSFRVPLGGIPDLEVKLWSMADNASLRDKPSAGREIACEARDISVGGIGLTIRAARGKLPAVAGGDRVRVQITLRGTKALLDGHVRYPPRAVKDSTFRAGVQFRELGESRDDRAASTQLNKIVNELQRELIRRKRLGLPAA